MDLKKNSKKTTLYHVILKNFGLLSISVIIILSVFMLILQYSATSRMIKSVLTEEIKAASNRVTWVVQSYKNVIESIGTIPELSMKNIDPLLKKAILKNRCNEFGLINSQTIKLDGFSEMDSIFRGDREYFHEAKKGKTVISDPIISRSEGKISLIVASPVWRGGIYKGTIDSVVWASIKPSVLNEVVDNLKFSKNSDAYIISSKGTYVAAVKDYLVVEQRNTIDEAQNDSSLKKIAKIESRILNGNYDLQILRKGLSFHYFISAPIEGTPGWCFIVESPITDYLQNFYVSLLLTFVFSIITVIVVFKHTRKIANSISIPVKRLSERLHKAAAGDFSSEVEIDDSLDEMHTISEATRNLVNRMSVVIKGNDSYKKSSNLVDLVDFNDYGPMNEKLKNLMHLNFSVRDLNNKILLGDDLSFRSNVLSEPIMIYEKPIGFYQISPNSDCTMTDENLSVISKVLTFVTSKIAENAIRRQSIYSSWVENELYNLSAFLKNNEEFSQLVSQWVKELEEMKIGTSQSDLKSSLKIFTAQANDIISKFEENAEYARFTEFRETTSEDDYTSMDLVNEIKNQISSQVKKASLVECAVTDLPDFLFGNKDSIIKISSRIGSELIKFTDNSLMINYSAEKETYSTILKINFNIDSTKMDDELIGRLKLISKKTDYSVEKLSTFEKKIFSAFSLCHKLNATIKIEVENNNLNLTLSIPQLAVKD